MKLGKSQRDKNVRQVASVAAYKGDAILWLRREDVQKWTLPGGHLNAGENPRDGAIRELKEETGLEPDGEMTHVGSAWAGDNLIVHSFVCEVKGEPNLKNDPDEEADKAEFFENPPENQYVPTEKNVTLFYLGLTEGKDVDPVDSELSKSTDKHWKSRDGVKIPHKDNPARREYDKKFAHTVAHFFANGDMKRLRKVKVPVDQPTGGNMAVNKDRLKLYTRMAMAGDNLPPVVVRRNGIGYSLIDGNHRQAAAQKAGLTHLDAFEVV